MALAERNPIQEALRRFERLAPVEEWETGRLAGQARVRLASAGTELLALDSGDSRQLLLIEGELELVAGDGARHRVHDRDPAARGPISRLRPSRYRVVAVSKVRYLMVEQALLDGCSNAGLQPAVVVDESFPVDETSELIDDAAVHPVMFDILDDLNHSRIVVPSDARIAARVGAALGDPSQDLEHFAQVLAICPALSLKVIRTAMAVDPEAGPPRSCRQAIETLGQENVYALAANCVLRESLRTQSPLIAKRIHEWWQRTMRVTAISSVLARMTDHLDPDFAALIGLLHSIAEPVVLGHAERHRDLADGVALDNVVYNNRGAIGRMLTTSWGLPREICEAAALCNHWGYDHPGKADYTDVVLVAQWHATLGASTRRRKPANSEIPAFGRLGLASASPELSLKIIEAADNAIDRSERLLGPDLV